MIVVGHGQGMRDVGALQWRPAHQAPTVAHELFVPLVIFPFFSHQGMVGDTRETTAHRSLETEKVPCNSRTRENCTKNIVQVHVTKIRSKNGNKASVMRTENKFYH